MTIEEILEAKHACEDLEYRFTGGETNFNRTGIIPGWYRCSVYKVLKSGNVKIGVTTPHFLALEVTVLKRNIPIAFRRKQQSAMNNYARFFAHLAENISILKDELGMDLSAIHAIDFYPHLGDIGWWWMDVDVEEMYVLVERDRVFGKCEIVLSDSYKDFRQLYGIEQQAQEVQA